MKTLIVLIALLGPPIISWLLIPKPKTRYERSVRAERFFKGWVAMIFIIVWIFCGMCVIGLILNQAWKPLGGLAVLGIYFYSIKV